MDAQRSDLLQGTLDVLILKIVALGPLHGYGIAQRIRQISKEVLQVQQGSLYPALHRLEKRGWLSRRMGRGGDRARGEVLCADESGAQTTGGRRRRTGIAFRTAVTDDPAHGGVGRTPCGFGSRHGEAQLNKELRYHFESLVRDSIAAGIDPAEARRRARLEFGGVEQIKEDCRDVRGRWLEDSGEGFSLRARERCAAARDSWRCRCCRWRSGSARTPRFSA